MEYWVDGYNLILRRGGQAHDGTLERAREDVLRQMSALKVSVRVYFDADRQGVVSSGGPTTRGRVRAIFVRSGSADDAIVEDLRKRERAREVTVVTDDRELRMRVKQLHGNTLGIQKFSAKLSQALSPVQSQEPVKNTDVDEWLDYFGIDEDWQPD